MPVSLGDGLRRVAAFFLNLEEECGSNYNGLAVSEGFHSASRTQPLPPAGAPGDQSQAEIEARVMGSPEGSSQTSRTPSFSDSWTPPRPAASEWTASTRHPGEAPHRPVGPQANHRIKSGRFPSLQGALHPKAAQQFFLPWRFSGGPLRAASLPGNRAPGPRRTISHLKFDRFDYLAILRLLVSRLSSM